ncbi:WD40-repeat-containing domain protein [Schizophyllum commune]
MLGPPHGLQQQNPNGLQNQQNQQGQAQDRQGLPLPPPQNGQDFTLSSVLHFLQTEWRRYERDRNEWEIERAEMRARIALLEGERRSFENVKLDLMRRIKMLEYALRMERSKQLTQPASVPPTKLAQIQAQTVGKPGDTEHKEESSGSSPRSEDSPLPDARLPNGNAGGSNARPGSWGGVLNPTWGPSTASLSIQPSTSIASGLGKPPPGRDPKSRARSRDYLKQCLQEITYLTSPQAMNPLPNRPLVSTSLAMNNGPPSAFPINSGLNSNGPNTGSNSPAQQHQIPGTLTLPNVPMDAYNGRPRKVMPDVASGKEFPAMINGMNAGGTITLNTANQALMSGPSSAPASSGPLERRDPMTAAGMQQQNQQQPSGQQQQQPEESEGAQQGESRQITAIFRPDDAGSWREQLKQAHDRSVNAAGWQHEGEEEGPDQVSVEEEDGVPSESESSNKKWHPRRTLRSHLDTVRAVAFHPTELCLATGGDDCTVKIWRMDVSSLATAAGRPAVEVEPQLTLRGHSAGITRLIHSPSKGLLYSASLDSSIRIWALPSPHHTTYAPYDETRARGELIGHTDAVWDLALVRDESTLISCGAEGRVKVWDVSGPSGGGELRMSWGYNGITDEDDQHDKELLEEDGTFPGATSVEALKTDLKRVAVAYQNAVVKIFDIATGKEVARLASDISYDGTPATQVNRIVSHPTSPLLVTAHEDKFIRIFDLTTGQCTHSMLAHLDGVTALSIDAAGLSLVSGSHDCSVRFWDLLGTRECIQELTAAREKGREGVLDLEFHPTMPVLASAGADGLVKLFASSTSPS